MADDFAAAMRIVQLIVTMPHGREHTSVPCDDLRCLARVLIGQQERIVELTSALHDLTQWDGHEKWDAMRHYNAREKAIALLTEGSAALSERAPSSESDQ